MNFVDYFEKFEKMQRWIRTDLTRSSILAKANFLVAMGIFNYIEILGSFYSKDDHPHARFNSVFENLLPKEYKKIYEQINKLTISNYKNKKGKIKKKGGAYDCLRCGLTHEYLVKVYTVNNSKNELSFIVFGVDDEVGYMTNILSKKCGLEIFSISKNKYTLKIYNPRLIYDLEQAFENFKAILLKDKKIKQQFEKKCKAIHLENFL